MSTQLILLERVEKLGNMGDVVSVKPGFARNYLLPQKKALRASKDNIAYFEAQKKTLEAENEKRKKEAEKLAKKIEGAKISVIRQASESGQLYGSVNSRDIAENLSEHAGETIPRTMVSLNDTFKQIGLFPVFVFVHPEVKVEVVVNIARTAEEAKIQVETGKALVSGATQEAEAEVAADAPDEDALKDVLDDDALEAEKGRQADAEEKAAEDAVKDAEKAAKKAEKDAAKAAAAEAEAESAEGDAPAEEAASEEAPAEEEATEE